MEIFYNFIFHPSEAVDLIKEKGNNIALFFLLLLSVASYSVSKNLINSNYYGSSIFLTVISPFVFTALLIGITSVIINFIAEVGGIKGYSVTVIKLMYCSLIPNIFLTPFATILLLTDSTGLYPLVYFLTLIWIIVIQVIVLSKYYSISKLIALLLAFSPIILIFFLFFFLIISFIILVFYQLATITIQM